MQNQRSFFLISQVFYPDEVSTANLFTKLCAKIAEDDNYLVNVWCAQPSYNCLIRQPRNVKYKNIQIKYLASTNFKKGIFFGRLVNYITFAISVIFNLVLSKDKSAVFTHTTPPSLGIIIAFLCKIKNRRFNYILLDIFPEGLIRLGKIQRNNLFVKLWEKFNQMAFKNSNKIIVIGRDMESWLFSKYKSIKLKVHYLPIWQDENLIRPADFETNPFVIKNNLQCSFVVQYSGNMGLWNDMKTLGEAVNMCKEDVVFTFIGGGMRKKELINAISVNTMKNVLLFDFISNEEYSYSVTACHIALVSLSKGLEGMAVPSKITGIMAAGVPVVAAVPEESEIAYIVNEENCGIVVQPDDANAILNAIIKLKSDVAMRKEMSRNARCAFEKKFTTSTAAEFFKDFD